MYLEGARGLLRTPDRPEGVSAKVVPGLCRQGMEAARIEAFWRRGLSAGRSHAEIEAETEALSRACHHQESELLPTAPELRGRVAVVVELEGVAGGTVANRPR